MLPVIISVSLLKGEKLRSRKHHVPGFFSKSIFLPLSKKNSAT